MEPSVYDLTYNDLNPRFLFCCNLLRTEPEMNYHCHDFIEFVFILKGKTTFRIDEKLYDVEEGSVILLNRQPKLLPRNFIWLFQMWNLPDVPEDIFLFLKIISC